MIIGKCKFNGIECSVTLAKYGNDRKALMLDASSGEYEGEPVAVATVNLPDDPINNDDEVFIKNWSENEGILEALQEAGIVGKVIGTARTGMAIAHKVEINYDVIPKQNG